MGRTFRKNLKKYQAYPHLVYLLRKWKSVVNEKHEIPSIYKPDEEVFNFNNNINWADWDDDDDGELPPLPLSWYIPSSKKSTHKITFIKDYVYRNS